MKKIIFMFAFYISCTTTYSQKDAAAKGSKNLTIQKKDVATFKSVEVRDALEISLIKGEKSGVELEADESLQDAIGLTVTDDKLVISAAKTISIFKKLKIRVTYTNDLNMIIAKDKAIVNALEEMSLKHTSFKSYNNSKLFLNLNIKNFQLVANDDSRIEINLKSDNADIQINGNSQLKALIATTTIKCDLYQKGIANIEGDCIKMQLRADNSSKFTGDKFTAKSMKLIAESDANCSVFVENIFDLEASGNAEIDLYGNPKINLIKFADNAILSKKTLK